MIQYKMPRSRKDRKIKKRLKKTKRIKKGGRYKSNKIHKSSQVYHLKAGAGAETFYEDTGEEVYDNIFDTIFIDSDVILNRSDDIKIMHYINVFLSQMKNIDANVVIYIKPYNLEIDISGKDKLDHIKIINPETLLPQEENEVKQAQNIITNMINNLQKNKGFYSSKSSMFISDNDVIVDTIEKNVKLQDTNLKGLKVFNTKEKTTCIQIIIMIINHLQEKNSNKTYLGACLKVWEEYYNRK